MHRAHVFEPGDPAYRPGRPGRSGRSAPDRSARRARAAQALLVNPEDLPVLAARAIRVAR